MKLLVHLNKHKKREKIEKKIERKSIFKTAK